MTMTHGGEEAAPVTAPEVDRVAELEMRLGLYLADRPRALSALTHKSYVNEHREEAAEDNERLEFLGDAVVDLLVSHRLMERFPQASEGQLSKMRAAVVDEPGLAAMARSLRLGELLRLGRGEELTGGREKSSLLADAMEAVIAAVFLEHGLPGAEALLGRSLEEAYARANAGTLDRDYKTQLQEVCQNRFRISPRYYVTAEHGPDHHKVFEVEAVVKGEVMGKGAGRSKKDAEQAAACRALELLHSPATPAPDVPPPLPAPPPAPATEAVAPPPPAQSEPEVFVPPSPAPRVRKRARSAQKKATKGRGTLSAGRPPRDKQKKSRARKKPKAKPASRRAKGP